jgi:uncharacterized protein
VTLLVDTNVWIAAHDEHDPDHGTCAAVLRQHANELASPVTVVTETAWFLEDRHGPSAESSFLRLITTGVLDPIDLTATDWERCVEMIDTYLDLGLGVVDASIVAVAERLGLTTIATMNTRDFRVVRPAHIDTFELLPTSVPD